MKVRVIRIPSHEHVAAFRDPDSGLRAYIAIHNTALGPAVGGVRMKPYRNEAAALEDALRLSRAMTYKAALAGLPLGGGKSVIVGDPSRDKSPALWEAFGRCLESLEGRYVAGEDMGTTPEDMDIIARVSRHVLGTNTARGGTGNPAVPTARGVVAGIRAALKWRFRDAELSRRRVAIQGLGAVGMELAVALFRAGARLVVSDVRENRVEEAKSRFPARAAAPEEVHRVECDVFAPCALGGTLNEKTADEMRCAIVAGSANNQLSSPEARNGSPGAASSTRPTMSSTRAASSRPRPLFWGWVPLSGTPRFGRWPIGSSRSSRERRKRGCGPRRRPIDGPREFSIPSRCHGRKGMFAPPGGSGRNPPFRPRPGP